MPTEFHLVAMFRGCPAASSGTVCENPSCPGDRYIMVFFDIGEGKALGFMLSVN